MSYTPTTWATGDVITAEKLNNMESGIVNAGNIVVVPYTPNSDNTQLTFEKTANEIMQYINNGFFVVGKFERKSGDNAVVSITTSFVWLASNLLYCHVWAPIPDMFYVSATSDGYQWIKSST